jgi:hypothetical protein
MKPVLIYVSGGIADEHAGAELCEIRDGDNGEPEFTAEECAQAESAARLAKAAPALLAALEELVADNKTLAPKVQNAAVLERAEAAISLAKWQP